VVGALAYDLRFWLEADLIPMSPIATDHAMGQPDPTDRV
jgi:hypothetical protein